jgi:glycosyltransferase involved in cell wall biosynthesis
VSPFRIAFVVQRYGLEVNGGAEYHCRQVAERVARRADVQNVTVLTTCAKDYRTWGNHYAAGTETIHGVQVERYSVEAARRPILQALLQPMLRHLPHPAFLERIWLRAQGPYTPKLVQRLSETRNEFDAIVFFTYLYYPTVMGMAIACGNRIFWPTAHDEAAIHFSLFEPVFRAPEAIAFNSEEERRFVLSRFPVADKPKDIIGCGIDFPDAHQPTPPRALYAPYLLYLGRIAKNKGVHRLVEHFARFKRTHRSLRLPSTSGAIAVDELKLVLAGTGDTRSIPKHDDVIMTGFVSEADKQRWLTHCEAVMMPSRFESLSLVTLEAWAANRPVLVDAACAVTRGHVERSKGGLAYDGVAQFEVGLRQLLESPRLRSEMGAAGRRYVEENYSWPEVESRFMALLRRVIEANPERHLDNG